MAKKQEAAAETAKGEQMEIESNKVVRYMDFEAIEQKYKLKLKDLLDGTH